MYELNAKGIIQLIITIYGFIDAFAQHIVRLFFELSILFSYEMLYCQAIV